MTAFLYQRSLITGVGRFPAERVAARAAGLRFTPGISDTAWAHAGNGLPLPCKASAVPGDPGANSREFASPPLDPSLAPPRVTEEITRSRRLGPLRSGSSRKTGCAGLRARPSRDFHLARERGEPWHVGCSLAG